MGDLSFVYKLFSESNNCGIHGLFPQLHAYNYFDDVSKLYIPNIAFTHAENTYH